MRKLTNTLSPSPKGFQSPKFSDSDFREVRGLGRPKSSDYRPPATDPSLIFSLVFHLRKLVVDWAGRILLFCRLVEVTSSRHYFIPRIHLEGKKLEKVRKSNFARSPWYCTVIGSNHVFVKAYTKPPRKSYLSKPQHRTITSQFEKWVDPNNYIYLTRSIPTSLFMSNYKQIRHSPVMY
jgi:hypothetical protein